MSTKFERNAWYAAARSEELRNKLLARILLRNALALNRKKESAPALLEDRCLQSCASSNLGCVHGDDVQCDYHGLCFSVSGVCTQNPGSEVISPLAREAALHLVECHRVVCYCNGKKEVSGPALISDSSHIITQGHQMSTGSYFAQSQVHYELVTDNLLDLTQVGSKLLPVSQSQICLRMTHLEAQSIGAVHGIHQ